MQSDTITYHVSSLDPKSHLISTLSWQVSVTTPILQMRKQRPREESNLPKPPSKPLPAAMKARRP